MIALPSYIATMPRPEYTPSVDVVAALLAPLSVLCPLIKESQLHGVCAVSLQSPPKSGPNPGHNLVFLPYTEDHTSAHQALRDPWQWPGPRGKVYALEQATLAFATAVSALFGRAFSSSDTLRLLPHPDGQSARFFLDAINLRLPVPAGPDAPLHLATLLAVIHSTIINGRGAGVISTWTPVRKLLEFDNPAKGEHISFLCPGSDTADRRRIYTHLQQFGAHASRALGVPFPT